MTTDACCLCCVAAAERNELDHLVSNECPLGGCDYHHPLTPSAVEAARERLYACTCPPWPDQGDFDGVDDYAAACGCCPQHGTGVRA